MQGGQLLGLAGGTDPVSSSLVLGHPQGSALISGQRGYEGRPAPFHQAHPRSSSQPEDLHLASRGAGKCHWSPAPPQGRRPQGQQEDTGGAVSHRAAAPALWWRSQVTPTLLHRQEQGGGGRWGVHPAGGRVCATGETRTVGGQSASVTHACFEDGRGQSTAPPRGGTLASIPRLAGVVTRTGCEGISAFRVEAGPARGCRS